jgi:hypothetical protein
MKADVNFGGACVCCQLLGNVCQRCKSWACLSILMSCFHQLTLSNATSICYNISITYIFRWFHVFLGWKITDSKLNWWFSTQWMMPWCLAPKATLLGCQLREGFPLADTRLGFCHPSWVFWQWAKHPSNLQIGGVNASSAMFNFRYLSVSSKHQCAMDTEVVKPIRNL